MKDYRYAKVLARDARVGQGIFGSVSRQNVIQFTSMGVGLEHHRSGRKLIEFVHIVPIHAPKSFAVGQRLY
jgi:hypothetical protein